MARGQTEAVPGPSTGPRGAGAIAEASDGQLLARFAAGRDQYAEVAFEALVRRHGPMVLRVCHQVVGDRHAAEDAFQATFLVLARRAGSIRQPELLGNWLHGVALRTAREARMRDDRRRRRESPGGPPFAAEPVGDSPGPDKELVSREMLDALHEEVWRLPERYRIPVVLCDLEGLTQEQAAQRLSCPPGTIGVRLRRARERLRVRLIRRGLAPTASLLGVLLRGDGASAAMPGPLVRATVGVAMASASGAAGGVASPAVTALADRVLHLMAATSLKAAIGLALGVLVGIALWAFGHRPPRVEAPADPPSSRPDREISPASRPSAPERVVPRPVEEPPPPSNAAGPVLAAIGAGPGRVDEEKARAWLQPGRKVAAAPPAPAPVRRPRPEEIALGEALFAREWLPDDPRAHGGDGLGPVYNETSCVACHGLGAPGGAGPESKNVLMVTAIPNGCGKPRGLDSIMPVSPGTRSAVVHHFSTDPSYSGWRSRLFDQPGTQAGAADDPVTARISALRERRSPEGHRSRRTSRTAAINGLSLVLVERNTPPLFGLGLLDAIPSDVLVARAGSEPPDVRGRVGRTREGRIGRFGWKAQLPSLHEFVRVACANELGLEVPGHPQALSATSPGSKPKGLDLTEHECDALAAYVRSLPAPLAIDPERPPGMPDLQEGRRLFEEVGCAACHAPSLGDVKGLYSDLLLHDMGPSLGDSGSSYGLDGPDTPEGPGPQEWRTPPLWGYRDSGPYLHDGRAQGLEEAVAFHDGQGAGSSRKFFSLSWRERGQVEAFLKSLVAPPAAAAPGMILAADLEARRGRKRPTPPEDRVRQQRQQAVARDEARWKEDRRRERVEEAIRRARAKLPLAQSLEKMGKTTGAINFYREIAREAAGTDEARLATERINLLSTRVYYTP